MTRDEKIKRIEDIEKELAELKESIKKEDYRPWKPEVGDTYYFIASQGDAYLHNWDDDYGDKGAYAIGNVFRTDEDAKFALEKLKVIHELKQFAEPKERAWNGKNEHVFIEWDFTLDKIDIYHNRTVKRNLIYFESIDMAEKAIAAVGKERIKKYYLEVE